MASTSLWRSLSAPMPSASSAKPFKSLKAAMRRRPRPCVRVGGISLSPLGLSTLKAEAFGLQPALLNGKLARSAATLAQSNASSQDAKLPFASPHRRCPRGPRPPLPNVLDQLLDTPKFQSEMIPKLSQASRSTADRSQWKRPDASEFGQKMEVGFQDVFA